MSTHTPDTDALVPQFLSDGEIPDIFAHCRKLEEERNKWAEMCDQYKQERDSAWQQEQMHHDNLVDIKKERDHWKKIASAFETLMPPVGGKRILKIIERDGWKCAYCGIETCFNGFHGPRPTVDHITPKAKGGLDHIANCVVACKKCNSEKSDQLNWLPYNGEEKTQKVWTYEDGKFRKKDEEFEL